MKRKLALLIASAMVLSSVPAVSFAATTNRISNVVTGDDDTDLINNAPTLRMYEKDLNDTTSGEAISFQLDLANAEWLDGVFDADEDGSVNLGTTDNPNNKQFIEGMSDVVVTRLSARSIIIEGTVVDTKNANDGDNVIAVKMFTTLTDEGDATVTIDPLDSVISSGSYKFATVAEGSTTTTVEKKKDVSENGATLKNIVIKETSPNAIQAGSSQIKLKLTSDWSFKSFTTADISVYPSEYKQYFTVNQSDIKDEEAYITITNLPDDRDQSMTISFAPTVQYDDDEVEPGDICEMTVSGADISKTTLEVATAVTYGVTWEAEDKTVPTFYWGSADNDDDTLQVHFEETVANSWLSNRKTKVVFPEEVKVLGVDIENLKNVKDINYSIDDNEITLEADGQDTTDTVEADFTFQISVEPGFTGDITATIQGKGVDEEISAVVATAAAPVTVTAESTDAVIDYRQTEIGDITITEAEAGILGKDDTLQLEIANLEFDDDPVVEVTSGDLKIDTVKTDGGVLKIKIKSESAKEPAVIKVTGVNLYMERNIPAGSYALKLSTSDAVDTSETTSSDFGEVKVTKDSDGRVTNFEISDQSDAIFKNSVVDGDTYDSLPVFDTRKVTVVEDYVNVVTAGRDQGDNTFTTQIKVTIGATEMYANDTAIALDVPAYISNGYTMLPVRAVTEALSSVAVVRWDDPTHTVTISFGERVVKMTVGSNVMVVNGVEVPMQAQCEITGERAFIPLRDMGYALGLNDSKIVWDDATKTATLN